MNRSLLVVALLAPGFLRAEEPFVAAKYLTIVRGDLPIVLSAPHGGRMPVPGVAIRKGEGVEQFVTVRDDNTAEVTLALAATIEKAFGAKPHVVIAHFERKFVDVNRPASGAYEAKEVAPLYDAYHAALDAACKQVKADWGRGLLLDIHGQAAEVDGIFRGTVGGKSVSLLIQRYGPTALVGEKSLLGVLEAKSYKILPGCKDEDQKETKFGGGHITQSYGSHTAHAIDAIQLELGTNLRAKVNHEKLVADLLAAIQTFSKAYLPEKKVQK